MVGVVEALWRYPVKSMLGEGIPDVEVTERGLAGDRRWAVLDRETGLVASAKNPRLWRGLLGLAAAGVGAGPRITGPDGKPVRADALSEALGRAVELIDVPPTNATLERAVPEEVLSSGIRAEVAITTTQLGKGAPAGTFFDFAPLHLLTTATLDRIAGLSPRGRCEAARYRPNLVIDTGSDAKGFVENGWVGRELRIGPDLRMRLIATTPRCAVPTLAHGELPRDTDALRVVARHNLVEPLPGLGLLPCAGVYAQVVRPGRISEGDEARLR